jgi:hypothetical protein
MLEQMITEYILIPTAYAQTDGVTTLLGKINEHVINPLVVLLFAVAFVQFVIGLFKFFGSRENAEELQTGKRHMLWGIIGMAIMVSVFGIMNLLTNTIGTGDVNPGESGEVSGLFSKG